MKPIKCLAVLFLLLCRLPADAQVWCPAGATWYFGFNYGQSNGYNKYTYTGDTVIGGMTQQLIAVEAHYYTQNPPGYHDGYADDPIYTLFADSVLYSINTSLGIWDTLIWYGAVPGDKWQVFQPNDSFCDCWYSVTDTGHTVVAGMSLRYVQTTITDDCSETSRRFLERIGSVHGTFLGECQIGVADTSLRCYQDVDMSYVPPNAPACDFISGIAEENRRPAVTVFPNPGTDVLHIEAGAKGRTDVRVLDGTGRQMLSVSGSTGPLELPSGSLAPGVYFVEVRTAQGRRTVRWTKR